MNILSDIVHRVLSDLHPKVADVVEKIDETAERIEQRIEQASEHVEREVEKVEEVVTRPLGKIVERILDATAARHKKETGEDLTRWRQSIVDTMKLAGVDSSLAHRKQMAEKFGRSTFTGSAADNIWLSGKFLVWLRERL